MLRFLIHRPIATAMIYAAILLIGAISLGRLRVSLFPDIQIPQLTILTPYPNVAPEEMENLVTRPIEDAVSSVNGVRRVTSKSQEGLSIVEVFFEWGTSLDLAIVNTRQKVDLAKSVLPQDAEKSIIVRSDPSADPVITLVARPVDLDSAQLRDYIDNNVRPFLERIDGVASISVLGGQKREIQVRVDAQKLFALGLTLEQLRANLESSNFSFPAGTVRKGDRELTVRVQGEFQNIQQIGETVVAVSSSGSPVQLRTVARIEDSFRERRGSAFYNGEPAVILGIKKEPDANTIRAAENIRNALTEINARFGKKLRLEIVQDRSDYVLSAIANVRTEALTGGIIAVLILFLFLRDLWPSLIISITLPVAIITTFACMYLKGLSLNIMSLGGMALGVGMLLDSAIVVIESITLEREEHPDHSLVETAVRGTSQVVGSVISAAGTTIVVFVPIIFVPGIAGEVFRDFAFTITFSLLSSLICSLTLVPVMFALPVTKVGFLRKTFAAVNGAAGPAFRAAEHVIAFASRLYDTSIDYSMRRPLRILGISFGLGALGIAAFAFLPRSLFPDVDQGIVQAEIEMPAGTTLEENEALQAKIHGFLKQNNLSFHAITTTGFDSDDLSQRVKGIRQPNHSESLIYIDRDRMTSREFNRILAEGLSHFSNMKTTMHIKGEALQELLGETSPMILAEVEHRDRSVAREAAERIAAEVRKSPGIVSLHSTAAATDPEIKIFVDREKVAAQGLSIEAVSRTIHTGIAGAIATGFREGDREIDVRVRLRPEDRGSLETVRRLLVSVGDGKQMEIGTFLTPTEGLGRPTILRENQRRIEHVRIEYERDAKSQLTSQLESVLADTRQKYASLSPEQRPEIRLREDNEETSQSLAGLVYAFAISAVLIYMLLAGQFESLVHPITLALIIPLMLFGVSGALLITGHGLNISSAIGIILLAGIVVDAATVLYEYIEQKRGEGGHDGSDLEELPQILKKCGRARIRAILLTSLTNMLGSLPSAGLASSGNLQAPMAVAIVGGLLVATVLTLVAFPTMFLVVERFRFRIRDLGTVGAARFALGIA